MFEYRSAEAPGGRADYGYTEALPPGAVDPVRLAALVAGFDAGGELLDPAEEALFGPEPAVDVAELFAAADAAGAATGSDAVHHRCLRRDAESASPFGAAAAVPATPGSGVLEPSVLVPAHVPGLEEMAPGPELSSLLDSAVDLSGLGAYEVVEAVAGWQRIVSWATARQATAVAELSRRAEMRPVQSGRLIESMSAQRLTAMEVAAGCA